MPKPLKFSYKKIQIRLGENNARIAAEFSRWWAATLGQEIKDKWKPVKTMRGAAPGKPFRIHSSKSPAKLFVTHYRGGVENTTRVTYKQGRHPSNWAQRMEFGGELKFKPFDLIGLELFENLHKKGVLK